MSKIGFLGCGKIGGKMLKDLLEQNQHEIVFVQDPFYKDEQAMYKIIDQQEEALLEQTDLVVETATADVLKANIEKILKYCDLMVFSVTAFSDQTFYENVKTLINTYHHKVFLPHGAILGVDGIADGKQLLNQVSIVTTKNPKSLGRTDTEKTVLYDGDTRGACKAYPRNVNVHATVALAGIGFDQTHSVIIADPSVSTNTHIIKAEGEGIHFEIVVSSFSTGGVTGKYTPYSAVASLHRVLGDQQGFLFV